VKRLTGLFLVFFCGIGFGCIPAQERGAVLAPGGTVVPAPLFPADLLDRRISFLSRTLEKNTVTEKDRQIAADLLLTYKSVKKVSALELSEAEYRQLVQDLLNSLLRMDESHFSQVEMTWDHSKAVSHFMRKRKEILEAYLSRDNRGVINHCLELQAAFGPDALTPEIGTLFALSLANEGMREEATEIIEGIVPELDDNPDSTSLQASIAELQLQLGEREAALNAYKKLTDRLHEQEEMLQALERKISSIPTQTRDEPLTSPAQPQRTPHVTSQLEEGTDHLLKRVDKLVQERKFGEAWDLLTLNRSAASSDADRESIDQALQRLEAAQEAYLEKTISVISKKKEVLKIARQYLEEEKFEQVLTTLDGLSQGEEGLEVKELRAQAIENLINRERNRAARVFLSAKRTEDPSKKEAYLRACYDILNSLVEKYPASPLTEKIRSHIMKVSEELEKLKGDSS
jgi:hypothetical protein